MPFLDLSDTGRIFYEFLEGNPDFPVLVFLHEGLGCTGMWKDFPKRLCGETGCPGLVYDRLGFGMSSSAECSRTIHYLHDSALRELPEVLQCLIPGRSYVLIGHSDGGSISLIRGAERPPLLRGIVTEAAHVFVEQMTIDGIRETVGAFQRGELKGLSRYHGEKTTAVFNAWADTWLSDWFRSWNIEYLLPSVVCPLLAVQGREDSYGSDRQVKSIVSGASGSAEELLVDDCGHSPHRERPESILPAMAEFIRGIVDTMS